MGSLPQIKLVTSEEEFHQWHKLIKEDSVTPTSPSRWVIGLDIEYAALETVPEEAWSYWIQKETPPNPVVCTLSISSYHFSMVVHFPFFGKSWPKKIVQILESPSYLKVGVGISLDFKYLRENFGVYPIGGIECQNLAILTGRKEQSLAGLYQEFYSEKVNSKKIARSNWTTPELSSKQIEYSGMDAYMSLMVFVGLVKPMVNLKPPSKIERIIRSLPKATYPFLEILFEVRKVDPLISKKVVLRTLKEASWARQSDLKDPSSKWIIYPEKSVPTLSSVTPEPSTPSVPEAGIPSNSPSFSNSNQGRTKHIPVHPNENSVSRLNQLWQDQCISKPKYQFGFDEDQEQFRCKCYLDDQSFLGTGLNKKEAKKVAAQQCLTHLGL